MKRAWARTSACRWWRSLGTASRSMSPSTVSLAWPWRSWTELIQSADGIMKVTS